jgi:hypothetical protein
VLPEEQQAVESVLYQFFSTEEDGTHRNSRCDDEIAKATAYSESCDKRARAGAAAKWKNHIKKDASSISSSNAKPMLNTCLADAQPQPQPHKDQSLSSDQSSDELPPPEIERKDDPKIAVRRVFAYYCQTIGKSAAYLLTDQRMKQGIARFRESSKLAVALKPGLAIEDVPDACEKLMMVAIDEMAKDDWAMGRDKNSKKTFNEWDNLFRSAEQYQKWINLRFGARLTVVDPPKPRQWAPITEMAPRGAQ